MAPQPVVSALDLSGAPGASGNPAIVPPEEIPAYEWDFGDGTTLSSPNNTQTHVYTSSGAKTVTVNVVPTAGAARSVTIQVQVT